MLCRVHAVPWWQACLASRHVYCPCLEAALPSTCMPCLRLAGWLAGWRAGGRAGWRAGRAGQTKKSSRRQTAARHEPDGPSYFQQLPPDLPTWEEVAGDRPAVYWWVRRHILLQYSLKEERDAGVAANTLADTKQYAEAIKAAVADEGHMWEERLPEALRSAIVCHMKDMFPNAKQAKYESDSDNQ
jgi:hypothetical protein